MRVVEPGYDADDDADDDAADDSMYRGEKSERGQSRACVAKEEIKLRARIAFIYALDIGD